MVKTRITSYGVFAHPLRLTVPSFTILQELPEQQHMPSLGDFILSAAADTVLEKRWILAMPFKTAEYAEAVFLADGLEILEKSVQIPGLV